jgi:hypothetical protein
MTNYVHVSFKILKLKTITTTTTTKQQQQHYQQHKLKRLRLNKKSTYVAYSF